MAGHKRHAKSGLEPLWDADAVASVLGVTRQRVYELTRQGVLPVVVLGERQYRYEPHKVRAFIEAGGWKPSRLPSEPPRLFRLGTRGGNATQ